MPDVLDDLLDDTEPDADEPTVATGDTFVCDFVDGDGVCGESFANAMYLGQHKFRKHGIAGKNRDKNRGAKPRGRPSNKDKGPGRKQAAPKAAAATAAGPSTDRAGTYTASLAMGALAAYLAVPAFNQTDLDICNAGAPNIGRSLGRLADHNASVARTCDLILGGGAGGDWIAVVMAVVPVVGALLANHGVIPATSGARFGEMIGVAPMAPSSPAPASPQQRESSEYPVDQDRTADEVIAFFAGTPETVMTDAMAKMMTMAGPIEVAVPFSGTAGVTENPDGERGSEQLKPVVPEVAPEADEVSAS